MAQSGLGGIAATEQFVLFGDRDLDNIQDVFRCVDAQSGVVLWEIARPGVGTLDYGNSPRSTPMVSDDVAYFQGAFGNLLCAQIADGTVLWEMDLQEFQPQGELPWGFCGTALLVDDRLIVSPGGSQASVVALEPRTGKLLWKSAGGAPSYGSMIVADLGGKRQIVGHDATSLGGWDIQNGNRLWTLTPPFSGDFNVPTPIQYGQQLLVVTENNGARLYDFDSNGTIVPQPTAHNKQLRPSMSTPVVVDERLYCVDRFLYCLDMKGGLAEKWRLRDSALGDYAALFATAERLLVVGQGELLLLGSNGEKEIISRQKLFDDNVPVYSHPAIVGTLLFVRGETKLICVDLGE